MSDLCPGVSASAVHQGNMQKRWDSKVRLTICYCGKRLAWIGLHDGLNCNAGQSGADSRGMEEKKGVYGFFRLVGLRKVR